MQNPSEPSRLSVLLSKTSMYLTLVPVFFSSSSQNTISVTLFWCIMPPTRSAVSGKRQMLRSPPKVPTIRYSSTNSKKQILLRPSWPWFWVRSVWSKETRLSCMREVRVWVEFQRRTTAQGVGGLPGMFAYLTPNTLDSLQGNNYICVALEDHLAVAQLSADEEQQAPVVGARSDDLGAAHLSDVQKQQLQLQVVGIEAEPKLLSVLCLLDEGVASLLPHLELSGEGGGEHDAVVEVQHAGDPARVGVLHVEDLLGGDVEDGHVFEHALRVGEGVVDVVALVVVEVVLQRRGQLRQRPREHVVQRLRLEVEIKKMHLASVPQREVVLPARPKLRQLALQSRGNVAHEVEPADRVLVVEDEIVLLLAVLAVLTLLVQVVVPAKTEERVAPLPPLEIAIARHPRLWLVVRKTILTIEIPSPEARLLLEALLLEAALPAAILVGILSAEAWFASGMLSALASLLSALVWWMVEVAISCLQFPAIGAVPANGSIASALH